MATYSNFKTSEMVLEDWKDELACLIPEIIRECLACSEHVEAEYAKRLEDIIERTFSFVSDFKFAMTWMGVNVDFLNSPPYNQMGYNWKSTLQTMKNTEEARGILDTIVNKIIEADCNASAKNYENTKDSLGYDWND